MYEHRRSSSGVGTLCFRRNPDDGVRRAASRRHPDRAAADRDAARSAEFERARFERADRQSVTVCSNRSHRQGQAILRCRVPSGRRMTGQGVRSLRTHQRSRITRHDVDANAAQWEHRANDSRTQPRRRDTMTITARGAIARTPGAPAEIEEFTIDDPGPNEVLVRILASGVCHTDLGVKSGTYGTERLPVPARPRGRRRRSRRSGRA